MEYQVKELLKKRYNKISKKWNAQVERLIEDWLTNLLTFYKPENNFLDKTPLVDYLNTYLNVLENLETLEVYTIEQVLENKGNYFFINV